jgi:AraC-like DNA-binding protein
MACQSHYLYYSVMSPPQPLIVFANYAQFAGGQHIAFDCVRSRMLLWCKAGSGQVCVNSEHFFFQTGDVLLTPWQHAIAYTSDNREPFFLAGVHIIPRQQPGTPLLWEVAHRPGELPRFLGLRQDAPWPRLEGLRRGHFAEDSPLRALAEYIVRRCQQCHPDEDTSRSMAGLLVNEMSEFFAHPSPSRHGLSIDLQRAMQFIDDHLQQTLYLEQAAHVANHSLSWLHRQFRATLGITPTAYVIAARIRLAKKLLATGNLNIGEVGQAVGIEDPYYFSKLFKQHTGFSPKAYRRRASLV